MKVIRSIDFLVPGLKTVSELNRRDHWAVKNRRKNNQQELVAVAMLNALHGNKIELPCVVKLTRIGPKKLDGHDGLPAAFKGIVDQICRQLGVDDGDTAKVSFAYSQMPACSREYAVRVSISSQE